MTTFPLYYSEYIHEFILKITEITSTHINIHFFFLLFFYTSNLIRIRGFIVLLGVKLFLNVLWHQCKNIII